MFAIQYAYAFNLACKHVKTLTKT